MSTRILKVSAGEPQDLDVVFIHGLNGDPLGTWSSAETDSYWPKWLSEDISGIGVWSIGYEAWASRWRGPAMPLQDRAINTLALMRASGIGSRPICFIAHSMGGLIVKQLVFQGSVLSPEFRREVSAVRGTAFLATPHTGSGLANATDFFKRTMRRTVAVEDLKKNSPYLRLLTSWYRENATALDIEHLVLYENVPTGGILVVDETSSDPGIPGVVPIRLDASHSSICKPQDRQDIAYRLCSDLVERVRAAQDSSSSAVLRDDPEQRNPATEADPTESLRSIEFVEPASIEFRNETDEQVDIAWHDYDGNEIAYRSVRRGETLLIETFMTHPWSAESVRRGRIGSWRPSGRGVSVVNLT